MHDPQAPPGDWMYAAGGGEAGYVAPSPSQHLWKTVIDGQHWDRISPDLTRADPKTLGDSGGPITKDQNGPESYGTIFTIAPSRHDVNTIWTGSDDGLVQVTRDGGKTWSNVTPARCRIEVSPHHPGHLLTI